jgi:hypothetical protein
MNGKEPTLKIDLPGGPDRLRQMILYVAHRCQSARRFGGIKLNKILWKSDFDAFADRGIPVTGRSYYRLKFGHAPREMVPLHREMLQAGLIRIDRVDFGEEIIEQRTVPLIDPDLAAFIEDDIRYVDKSIGYYWYLTGMEASDDSHGPAWSTRSDKDPMPYESALLSDRRPMANQMTRIRQMIYDRGLTSE